MYSYILDNTKYDYDQYYNTHGYNRYSQSSYGVLVNGTAVCDGYTRAMNLILELVDIESIYVIGNMNDGGESHAWNLVKIDGNYYHVDATHNDQCGLIYYLVSDDYMKKSRTWDYDSYPLAPSDY